MPCNHIGGPEMIVMAEAALRERNVPEDEWPGSHFRYIENLSDGMWAAVWLELERWDDQWMVTKIDRFKEALPEEEAGFRVLRVGK